MYLEFKQFIIYSLLFGTRGDKGKTLGGTEWGHNSSGTYNGRVHILTRFSRSLKPEALERRGLFLPIRWCPGWSWVTDCRHNSKLQRNHTKHKHTNPHTTQRKPATYLTRHHNHNKHTTKKHWLGHNAGTKLRSSANPDHLTKQRQTTKYNSTAEHTQTTTKQIGKNSHKKLNKQSQTSKHHKIAHTATKILTNAILAADKHHIPKGKIHYTVLTHKLLPEHIRNMIKQRNTTRQQNPKDPLLAQQNTYIDKEIQNHKQALWKQHLTDNWDHKTNTHTLWKTLNGRLAHKKPPQTPNITITFDNKTAITDKQKAEHFYKQFTNHVKHTTQRRYRHHRQIHKQAKINTPIQITIEQTSLASKQAKNNNSTWPDNINMKHLKHLGVTALTYHSNIQPLSFTLGISYSPIALLSPIAKTLEKTSYHTSQATKLYPHINMLLDTNTPPQQRYMK